MNCDGKAVHQTTTEVFLLLKIVWDVSCVMCTVQRRNTTKKLLFTGKPGAHSSTQLRCFGLDMVSSGANTDAPQQQGAWWHCTPKGSYAASVVLVRTAGRTAMLPSLLQPCSEQLRI